MRTIESLKAGDYIAFPFTYNGSEPNEIVVSKISSILDDGRFLTYFMYGHHSVSEYITPDNVLAIGNHESGTAGIRGWSGRFDLIQPDHHLIKKFLKP